MELIQKISDHNRDTNHDFYTEMLKHCKDRFLEDRVVIVH